VEIVAMQKNSIGKKKPSASSSAKIEQTHIREFRPGRQAQDAWLLLVWLNGKATPVSNFEGLSPEKIQESVKRVGGLISALRNPGNQLKAAFENDNQVTNTTDVPRSVKKSLQIVNDLLQGYPHRRWVDIFVDPEEGVGDDGLRSLEITRGIAAVWPLGEEIAVEQIIHLVSIKKFHLLRECSVCNTWFLAARSNQYTCSTVCRDTAYRQTEEYKAKQREIMRKTYHEKKKAKLK
jgi:hypothetical protein